MKLPLVVKNTGITVDYIRREDIPAAMDVVAKIFCTEEPPAYYARTPFRDFFECLVQLQEQSMSPVLTSVAKDRNSRIIAVGKACELNMTIGHRYAKLHPVPFFHNILQDLIDIHRESYHRLGHTGRVVRQTDGVVDPNHRGLGLAMYLELVIGMQAQKAGFKWWVSEDSNIFSRDVDVNNGFKVEKPLYYDEWETKMPNGKIEKPFAGLDEFNTRLVNTRLRKGKKPYKSTAPAITAICADVDGQVERLRNVLKI